MRSGRRFGGLFATVVVAFAAMAGAASAAPKEYTVVLTGVGNEQPPATVPAGQRSKVHATITNRSRTQQLGSANLTAPNGYAVAAATSPRGTVDVVGQVVQLREVALAPGASLKVEVTVDAPCTARVATWGSQVKHANDFNGTGNDFALDGAGSSLSTETTGACGLRFATQPQDAQLGQPVTGTDNDPYGPPIAVQLVGGDGQPSKADGVPVTLDGVSLTPENGELTGTPVTKHTSGGVASFPDVSSADDDKYKLTATTPEHGDATSDEFTVGASKSVQCDANEPCEGTLAFKGSNYRLEFSLEGLTSPLADAGTLLLAWNTVPAFNCEGYEERTMDRAVFDGPFFREKVFTYRLDEAAMELSEGPLQMCFAAPYPFLTRPESEGLKPLDIDGDGIAEWWYGLLRDCAAVIDTDVAAAGELTVPPPCVEGRSEDLVTGMSSISVRVPGNGLDPAGHG